MTQRRDFLQVSGAVLAAVAVPALANAANPTSEESKAQDQTKKFKITFNYIPGLVSVGNIMNGGGADKREKEISVTVEASDRSNASNFITWNADGNFVSIETENEIYGVPLSSVTRYSITPA